MDKIKLIIWDLDETFWEGTLSEEGVKPIQTNIHIVKELSKRGIINSIVSKNNFKNAQEQLIKLGIWDYFVFPVIEWNPKGPLIKELIDACQLRDTNVLFLDDNHLNLEEAKFYNPNIHARLPDFLNDILDHPALVGKNDKKLTRLNHYKILEKKYNKSKSSSNIIEFLFESNIKVKFIDDLTSNINRLYELIDRTNQLNFTKKRLSFEEIEFFLKESSNENRLIKVQDDFGDYGIVGFYSFNKVKNHLDHFVFSCRILNLGVEQYIYSKLGFPELDIIPEIAITLDNTSPIWINDDDGADNKLETTIQGTNLKLFFKGGCDLSQMLFYLNNYEISIYEETNYVNNGIPIHAEHSQIIVDSINKNNKEISQIIEKTPFLDEESYNTKIFSEKYNVLVYSVLMDYTQDLYKNDIGYSVPFGGYYGDLTDPIKEDYFVTRFSKSGLKSLTRAAIRSFSKTHKSIGQITPSEFINNLNQIRKNLDPDIQIVFINGSEIALDNEEKEALNRHILMNNALKDFVKTNHNCHILDVRNFVKTQEDVTDNIRHYSRNIYNLISKELIIILDQLTDKGKTKQKSFFKKTYTNFIYYFSKVINKIEKISKFS